MRIPLGSRKKGTTSSSRRITTRNEESSSSSNAAAIMDSTRGDQQKNDKEKKGSNKHTESSVSSASLSYNRDLEDESLRLVRRDRSGQDNHLNGSMNSISNQMNSSMNSISNQMNGSDNSLAAAKQMVAYPNHCRRSRQQHHHHHHQQQQQHHQQEQEEDINVEPMSLASPSTPSPYRRTASTGSQSSANSSVSSTSHLQRSATTEDSIALRRAKRAANPRGLRGGLRSGSDRTLSSTGDSNRSLPCNSSTTEAEVAAGATATSDRTTASSSSLVSVTASMSRPPMLERDRITLPQLIVGTTTSTTKTATTATVEMPHLLKSRSSSGGARGELEAIDEMAEIQRQRQNDIVRQAQQQYNYHSRPQAVRCGNCDDCLKGLPCLVANLDSGPGAFSVNEVSSVRRTPTTLTTATDSHHQLPSLTTTTTTMPNTDASSESFRSGSPSRYSPTSGSGGGGQARRRSSKQVMAVAAMVVEDQEDERQRELQEQAAQLAERAAQLQAWQEELERQRREMQAQAAGGAVGPGAAAPPAFASLPGPPTVFQPSLAQSASVQAASVAVVAATATTSAAAGSEEPPLVVAAAAGADEGNNNNNRVFALGPGPRRFANDESYSTRTQIMGLDSQMQLALREIQRRWQDRQDKLVARHGPSCRTAFPLDASWHLRFLWFYARQSPVDGSYRFSVERVWRAEKKLQKRFVSLNINSMRQQIETKTLFPVPGLKTMGGHSMFYMRPSRYHPGKTSTKAIIDNLCYVMNTMLENQFAQKEGIGFVACMDNWKMSNFEVNYCYQFMMGLQGVYVPVKTQLFLIVNPPSWFGVIWKIMKPMLAPSFRKRVKICPEYKIAKYLAPGFEEYLPDDMRSGTAKTDAMVEDFIAYRTHVENRRPVGARHAQRNQGCAHLDHSSAHLEHSSVHGGSSSAGDADDISVSQWSSADGTSCRGRGPDGSFTYTGSSTNSRLSGGSDGKWDLDDDDDDGASIGCDIDNEEALNGEDMKQSATDFAVHISNMPLP